MKMCDDMWAGHNVIAPMRDHIIRTQRERDTEKGVLRVAKTVYICQTLHLSSGCVHTFVHGIVLRQPSTGAATLI